MPPASTPVVTVCLDGNSQEYIDAACAAGRMPTWSSLLSTPFPPAPDRPFANLFRKMGSHGLVSGAFPTFTNPNNVAIMANAPPAVTGITGNYYLEPDAADATGFKEVPMTSPACIRADSVFAAMHAAGADVTVITAKDKLARLLAHQLPAEGLKAGADVASLDAPAATARVLSVEALARGCEAGDASAQAWSSLAGRAAPGVYDPDCSVFALDLAAAMLERAPVSARTRPSLLYVSTTDFVQHKHAPTDEGALNFMAAVDRALARLHAAGARIAVTADHGMNDKATPQGAPRIVFLDTVLAETFGVAGARVILPITDPYTKHHASLGGCAMVYLPEQQRAHAMDIMRRLRDVKGIYSVVGREDAAHAFDLPADRIGDMVVIAHGDYVVGKSAEHHDLSVLAGQRLRTHGSLEEATVPLWLNRALTDDYALRLSRGQARNYHMLDFVLNGILPEAEPENVVVAAAQ